MWEQERRTVRRNGGKGERRTVSSLALAHHAHCPALCLPVPPRAVLPALQRPVLLVGLKSRGVSFRKACAKTEAESRREKRKEKEGGQPRLAPVHRQSFPLLPSTTQRIKGMPRWIEIATGMGWTSRSAQVRSGHGAPEKGLLLSSLRVDVLSTSAYNITVPITS